MHSSLVRSECQCRCIYSRITHRYLSRRGRLPFVYGE